MIVSFVQEISCDPPGVLFQTALAGEGILRESAGKSHRGCGCAENPLQKRGDSLYAPFETCAMLIHIVEHGFS